MLNLTPLKATAGKALALLSTNCDCETNHVSVIMERDYIIVGRLAMMLDAKTNIIYRTIAAHILENLCAHGTLDQEHVKETLLPKVRYKKL